MIKGFMYFMLILLALWVVQGFGSFLVDMWPLIKWGILVVAFCIVIKQLGSWWNKETPAQGTTTLNVDPNGNPEVNND